MLIVVNGLPMNDVSGAHRRIPYTLVDSVGHTVVKASPSLQHNMNGNNADKNNGQSISSEVLLMFN